MEPVSSMAVGGLATGAAVGGVLFGYNRDNYLYDRKMRQKQEFKVLQFRSTQAGLWREDIRDLIDLTVGKMDSYTIVSALLFGFCMEFFSVGRLEPGTPQWILWLHILPLSGATAYLFMAVFFAMHASVASSASATRLLTQLVRLPVPSWDQLEGMRTYGSSCEALGARKLLRVPFLSPLFSRPDHVHMTKSAELSTEAADPWDLERVGHDIYELQHRPTSQLRHVNLVRRAAATWQCHEGFTRVCMTMGVLQLLNAIVYYVIGYVLVEDGEAWGAWFATAVLTPTMGTILHLDLSLSAMEYHTVCFLVSAGPGLSCITATLFCQYQPEPTTVALLIIPVAFLSHGFLLAYLLSIAGVQRQPNGTELPTRWRAVLFLDVFGWLSTHPEVLDQQAQAKASLQTDSGYEAAVPGHDGNYMLTSEPDTTSEPSQGSETQDSAFFPHEQEEDRLEEARLLLRKLRAEINTWQEASDLNVMSERDSKILAQVGSDLSDISTKTPELQEAFTSGSLPPTTHWLELVDHTDVGLEYKYLINVRTMEVVHPGDVYAATVSWPLSLGSLQERVQRLRGCVSDLVGDPTMPQGGQFVHDHAECCQGECTAGRNPRGTHLVAVTAAFPRPQDQPQEPVRPEDADWGPGTFFGEGHSVSDCNETALKGVGAPGSVHHANRKTFDAETFFPSRHGRKERVVTGHDSMRGTGPFRIFSFFTILQVVVYGCGMIWSLGQLCGFPDFSLPPLPLEAFKIFDYTQEEDDQLVQGPAGFRLDEDDNDHPDIPRQLLQLDRGEMIHTDWPQHPGFVPSKLSCDSAGEYFAITDALSVYSAQMSDAAARSTNSDIISNSSKRLHFGRAPLCPQLEGQVPRDISVICSPRASKFGPICKAVVLYADGNTSLVECPLQVATPAKSCGSDSSFGKWGIATEWLEAQIGTNVPEEFVQSVALNPHCQKNDNVSALFSPERAGSGCVVASTTLGRFAQLQWHPSQENLVPRWASAARQRRVSSLHVLHGAVVLALVEPSTDAFTFQDKVPLRRGVQGVHARRLQWEKTQREDQRVMALDVSRGETIGEWELPKHSNWVALCSGGSFLYALGHQNSLRWTLWRFSLPRDLHRT